MSVATKFECTMYFSTGGKKFQKKYVMVTSDDSVLIGDSKKSKKTPFPISSNTEISRLKNKDLGGDFGFLIYTPGQQNKYVLKTKKQDDASKMYALLRNATQAKSNGNQKARPAINSIYASSTLTRQISKKKLPQRKRGESLSTFEGSSIESRLQDVEGWVMKVGKGKNAADYFVNGTTWEYHACIEDSRNGKPPIGKALLALLV